MTDIGDDEDKTWDLNKRQAKGQARMLTKTHEVTDIGGDEGETLDLNERLAKNHTRR